MANVGVRLYLKTNDFVKNDESSPNRKQATLHDVTFLSPNFQRSFTHRTNSTGTSGKRMSENEGDFSSLESTEYQAQKLNTKRTKTVLVVDDDLVNCAILCRLLKQHGFATREATDGNEALAAIRDFNIDLVLLDISMPEMDGFEVLRTVRVEDDNKDIPIIMVTSSDESAIVVSAFEAGANDYITKPIDAMVTMARINMHLQLQESQYALRQSEERYSLIAQGTNDGVWDWDLTTNKIYYSPRWLSIFGIEDNNQNSPNIWFDRIHPEDRERIENDLEKHKAGLTPNFESEIRMRHISGAYRWTLCRGLSIWDENGVAIRMAGSLTDITEGKVADALTGLPNRVFFHERLHRCIVRRKRDPDFNFALLYLDLDNFKLVNDSLGHASGDRLLVAIARRLENSIRSSEAFISRLGGDEFSILIEGLKSCSESVQLANRIISSVASPISIGGGREIFASVSVGISNSSDSFIDADEMLQAADTAMYSAKAKGKSCHQVFDPAMKEDVSRRLHVENELHSAIDNDNLHLHYQPIVDLNTSDVIGFEALSRWTHPILGNISPAEYISIAEESGLIVSLGEKVLRKACTQLANWQSKDKRFNGLNVNVNLSSLQIRLPGLVTQVLNILDETGLAPECLKLEVTETSIMENPEVGAPTLSQLRKHGVTIAIDDFGMGYSSLSYIHELSPDVVKIDRSFIDQITSSSDKSTIVRAIIALADELELDVVAEGVETEEQRKLLATLGCKYAQGFYFACPLATEEMFEFATENLDARHTTNIDIC